MAKIATVTNVDNGDDVDASWGDTVKADIDALFLCKEVQPVAYAANKTFDIDDGDIQTVTLTGDIVVALADQKLNRPITLIFKQDGTGGRGITLFSTVLWAYGLTPTPATGANKYSAYMFIPVAYSAPSTWTYIGFILGEDFS